MNINRDFILEAKQETVFDCIYDPELQSRWMIGLERTEFEADLDPENPVGAKFRQFIKEGRRVNEYQGEVTGFERPNRLEVRLANKQFSMRVAYRLSENGDGTTTLNYGLNLEKSNFIIRLMGKLFSGLTKSILRKHMEALKELVKEQEGG